MTSLSSTIPDRFKKPKKNDSYTPDRFSKPVRCENNSNYKHTKLGWIPKEWELVSIEDVCNKFINGGTPSTKIENYWKGNIPWITGADIINQEIHKVRRFITNEAVQNSSTNVIKKGNLLVVTRTGVGKLTIAAYDIAISQDLTGVYCNEEKVNTFFLFYYLDYSIPHLARLNQGTSINGITRSTLIKHLIKLPPLPEQQKIAQILTTWDKAIEKTEQLIQAKTQLKKGLMKQLLTGKKRFKEFDGEEWKEYVFGDICRTYTGLSGKTKDDFGNGYPYIPYLNVINNSRVKPEQIIRFRIYKKPH